MQEISVFDQVAGVQGFIFSLVFYVIVNLLIIPYLFSIIIVIYNELRERNQETVEAISMITADKQKVGPPPAPSELTRFNSPTLLPSRAALLHGNSAALFPSLSSVRTTRNNTRN